MLKNYHSGKLTSRRGILNLGVFYPMDVYFVDKPFCGENATKGSMTYQKVRVYSLVPWQYKGFHSDPHKDLKNLWVEG